MSVFKTAGISSRSLGLMLSLLAVWGLSSCTMDVEERVEKLRQQSEQNIQAGQAFLKENSQKPGVVTTESGLQYRIIEAGDGRQPQLSDKVKAHYRGTLIDGTEFDSSYARGKPAVFPVDRLIPGWTEALQLMREGARWELYIPSQLAYGKKSPSRDIPPSSTLIFELELLAIENR